MKPLLVASLALAVCAGTMLAQNPNRMRFQISVSPANM